MLAQRSVSPSLILPVSRSCQISPASAKDLGVEATRLASTRTPLPQFTQSPILQTTTPAMKRSDQNISPIDIRATPRAVCMQATVWPNLPSKNVAEKCASSSQSGFRAVTSDRSPCGDRSSVSDATQSRSLRCLAEFAFREVKKPSEDLFESSLCSALSSRISRLAHRGLRPRSIGSCDDGTRRGCVAMCVPRGTEGTTSWPLSTIPHPRSTIF
jgi:hypothetical protein